MNRVRRSAYARSDIVLAAFDAEPASLEARSLCSYSKVKSGLFSDVSKTYAIAASLRRGSQK